MSTLFPQISARLARDVYLLTDAVSIDDGVAKLRATWDDLIQFEATDKNVTLAKTGGPAFLKSRTAFGLCVLGKGGFKGHAFFVFRGTRYLGDWLTNFNVGTTRSALGNQVHDGFHLAFNTMKGKLDSFIADLAKNGIEHVHCIGHSLGGGLASICAEYISANTSHSPYLYTFGAPRVGFAPFADALSRKLTPERMFRVYHRTDIVPCIPFWPFVHAPTLLSDKYDYFQPSPGAFPAGEWHDMKLYCKTVGKDGWKTLRGKKGESYSDTSIENWLKQTSPVSFTTTNIQWLDKAISWVVGKCLKGLGIAATFLVSSTMTIMDRIAYILKKGIDLSKTLSGWVMMLIRKIISMLGLRKVIEKADATKSFIEKVFQQLSQRVNTYCQKALDQVLVGGKAV